MSQAQVETDPLLPSTRLSTHKFVLLLLSLYFGVFIAAVDSTVTSTLLASIASDLKALDNISWVSTAYLVAYSALQPLYGKLSDIYGRKHILLLSTFFFGLGCYVCTLGSTITPVIIGRILNGVGAGGMLSLSSITVSDYVPSRRRGVYQGFGNIAFGTGAASGGIIGSAAQSYKGWRFAFFIQVPLSALSFLIVLWIMTEKKASENEVMVEDTEHTDHTVYRSSFERVDIIGSVSLALSVSLFMLAITTGGNQYPWKSWPIAGFFVASALSLAIFFEWESSKAIEPVLPIWLLTDRTILGTCFGNFFCSGLMYSVIAYVPIYLTATVDFTPSKISKIFIANFLGVSVGSVSSGLIMQKTGKYWTLGVISQLGCLVSIVLFAGVPFLPREITTKLWYYSIAFAILGISYASMLTVSLVCLVAAASKHQATATSAQYTFRGMGSSVGVALSAALFNSTLLSNLRKRITGDDSEKIIRRVFKSVAAIHDIPKKYVPDVVASYESAALAIFALCIAMAVLATISTAFAREYKLQSGEEEVSAGSATSSAVAEE